jgi:2-polyprenyl-3-methyl-5-hydroxy-6-metoxy-1,4-benzoquinol methylase
MKMYPDLDLYRHYKDRSFNAKYSSNLLDITKRITLENMNYAVNFADAWEYFLDIGGGIGHYSTALSAIFKKGAVVDVLRYKEHDELVRRYPNIEVVNKPIEEFEGNTKADFILLADIFEHIVDIRAFVQKLSDLQKKGGVVYIMTPNPARCGPAPESGIYHTRHEFGHQKHYTKEEIERVMTDFGYTLVGIFYEEGHFRQTAKRLINGMARRDLEWKENILYKAVKSVVLTLMTMASYFLGYTSYISERLMPQREFNALTQDLIFKKI